MSVETNVRNKIANMYMVGWAELEKRAAETVRDPATERRKNDLHIQQLGFVKAKNQLELEGLALDVAKKKMDYEASTHASEQKNVEQQEQQQLLQQQQQEQLQQQQQAVNTANMSRITNMMSH